MIKLHRYSGRQVTTDLSSEIHRVLEDSARRPIKREIESALHPNGLSHLDWERLAIWSFVVVNFAALFVAGYVIWAKCHG
jgi:hypothetical protein